MAIHTLEIKVSPEHIDQMGHVNNVVYLQWVQEVAASHWKMAAHADDCRDFRWVVRRHEIDYLKPALPGDILSLQTQVVNLEGVRSLREVNILRGDEVLAKALTSWIMVAADSGKPSRVSERIIKAFKEEDES